MSCSRLFRIASGRWAPSVVLLCLLNNSAVGRPDPTVVTFASGDLELHGWIWKPEGEGPFPAVLWNHGSEKQPGTQRALAAFYNSHGYVLFLPHRRGQGLSPGPYIQDLVRLTRPDMRPERMVRLQEQDNEDVVAALSYLKSQSFVDPARIAISGCSYGGIQTLLAGERDLGVIALIPFAPGAESWEHNTALQLRLRRAVDAAKAPVLLLQAANDYDLGPSYALGREAERKHLDFRAKVYPAVGKSHYDGHAGFCTAAIDVWGDDVLAFLAAHMPAPESRQP